MNHRARIEIAMRIKKKVLKKYGRDTLGIAIYGSVAKKADQRYSDLEMFVITRRKLPVREHRYIYKGIPLEISYISEKEMLQKARQITTDWPIVADFYRSYHILYERDDWFGKLEQAVAKQNNADFEKAIEKSLVWLFELIGKIKNAYLCKNNTLLLYLASFLGWESVIFLGLINRCYYRSERDIFKKVFEFSILPRNYCYLLETVCHFSTTNRETIYRATLKLFRELKRIANKQGVLLDQDRLSV